MAEIAPKIRGQMHKAVSRHGFMHCLVNEIRKGVSFCSNPEGRLGLDPTVRSFGGLEKPRRHTYPCFPNRAPRGARLGKQDLRIRS
jgi:hypothetical protein